MFKEILIDFLFLRQSADLSDVVYLKISMKPLRLFLFTIFARTNSLLVKTITTANAIYVGENIHTAFKSIGLLLNIIFIILLKWTTNQHKDSKTQPELSQLIID